jgi:hypothetical protein
MAKAGIGADSVSRPKLWLQLAAKRDGCIMQHGSNL